MENGLLADAIIATTTAAAVGAVAALVLHRAPAMLRRSISLAVIVSAVWLVVGCRSVGGRPLANVALEEQGSAPVARPPARIADSLDRDIDAYMLAYSDRFRERTRGLDASDEFERNVHEYTAEGLMAAAELSAGGAPAVERVAARLREAPTDVDGPSYEGWTLLSLCETWLGTGGMRIAAAYSGSEDSPAYDASDAAWRDYLGGTGRWAWKGPAFLGTGGSMLWWTLTRSHAALEEVSRDVEDHLENIEETLKDGSEYDASPEALVMQEVLLISSSDDGVSLSRLRDWATQPHSPGIQWGAMLGLAARGEGAGSEQVARVITRRFPLPPERPKDQQPDGFADEAEFILVLRVADSTLSNRWSLLMGLLEDRSANLTAPRTAVVVALGRHWSEFDAAKASRYRRRVARVAEREKSAVLKGAIEELLKAHPA